MNCGITSKRYLLDSCFERHQTNIIYDFEITALRSFIIEQLLVIKTMAKEKSTDSSACDPSKFSDEVNICENKITPKTVKP